MNSDIKKRLGCTKRGIYEIIENPFFEGFDWEGLLHRKIEPPFIPKIDIKANTSYKKFDKTIEEGEMPISKEKDPFYNLK